MVYTMTPQERVVGGSIPSLVSNLNPIIMTKTEFTMADAREHQAENLTEWKLVLKASVYAQLVKHVKERNKTTTDPYRVFRGVDFTSWVHTYIYANLHNERY